MNRLSIPPARLPPHPKILVLPRGLALLRFFDPQRGPWRAQRHYGPLADVRFDHHPPPCREHLDRSVWYAATSLRGAVAEAFGRQGFLDRTAGFQIVKATVGGKIQVLDLVGMAARAVGLTQEIATTTDYGTSQQWARAFFDHYPEIQGIRWRGRQSGSLCIVLQDRTEMHDLEGASWPLTDSAVWPRIARAARECRLTVV